MTVVKIVGYVSRLAKGITNVIAVDGDRWQSITIRGLKLVIIDWSLIGRCNQ